MAGYYVIKAIDNAKFNHRNMFTYFLVALYPGILFFSSKFFQGGSFYLNFITVTAASVSVCTYPYIKLRTLVRRENRDFALGLVVGIVTGLNYMMKGLLMHIINPKNKPFFDDGAPDDAIKAGGIK